MIVTTTFASNNFILGNYLNDNSEELFFKIIYRPIGKLKVSASYTIAKRGEDYPYTGTDGSGLGLPFIENVVWENTALTFKASYQLINDGYLFATFSSGNQRGMEEWTAPYYRGRTNTISAGMNIGF